ncbi:MAG: hypothetical protein HY519_01725, partial [Candidatus Aenigmarchaeota archaeon]|nr:hypothetical protein [Candidatus Aenigmarchaeota archaeon]
MRRLGNAIDLAAAAAQLDNDAYRLRFSFDTHCAAVNVAFGLCRDSGQLAAAQLFASYQPDEELSLPVSVPYSLAALQAGIDWPGGENGSAGAPYAMGAETGQFAGRLPDICHARMEEHTAFLNGLCERATPGIMRYYRYAMENSREIAGYTYRVLAKLADIGELIGASKPSKATAFWRNLRTFGAYERRGRNQLNALCESYMGWSLLETLGQGFAAGLEQDREFLAGNGQAELAQKVGGLSAFYRSLAHEAHYGRDVMQA